MKKILVIGESCVDVFLYGDCDRLSPEAPVPVMSNVNRKLNLGMADNVRKNLEVMAEGHDIECICQAEVIIKTRYIDRKSNHMFLRVDEGEHGTMVPFRLTDSVIERIKEADAVVVSDYNKGFLTEEILQEIAEHAKLSFLDSKKKLYPDTIMSYNYVKLNEAEWERNKSTNRNILLKTIITLGSRGAKYMGTLYPTDPKETIDVSGAGDTFLAAFVTKYLQTQDVDISITFANKMSAIVVSKRGVNTP
jgi:D-beta-D-heptose 7-phosphate kinase/D-beta-D-heptose 1-phosphate adenosyltransferase